MFIAIPVGMNYRTERLPMVTLSLIGINTLVYVVSLICFFSTAGASDEWIFRHLWLTPNACTWYACLTSMFVHEGIFHLAGNMIFLFLFGSCVEDMIGRLRFAIFYLLGGFIAEFVYIAMSPDHFQSPIPMGGASGAISACMGMYLLLRTEAQIEFKYFLWLMLIYFRAGEFEVPAWMAIGFWFLKDLAWALFGLFYGHGGGGGVAFGAHVGGLLGGAALVGAYRWLVHLPAQKAEAAKPIIDPVALLAAMPTLQPIAITSTETPTIYLHDGSGQTGPFTLTHVQAMLQSGSLTHDAVYWSEGMNDWQSVTDLLSSPMG
jgi:membrane associated rhomboid family serine protease